MAKKSVVLVVSFHMVDQDEIDDLTKNYQDKRTIQKILDIPLPGLERATIKDSDIFNMRVPESRQRFIETLYTNACLTIMEEPDKIYLIEKL
ncbi:hypothetical protein HY797_00305 [Candidatus Falkowbacteria bacterium]|nr:hypothetical protein [Candidatus Falkowbacteria bacterium]